jgi:hypothetical protein
MKQIFIYFSLILLSITLLSCSDGVDNSITFQNQASNDVFINFRGSKIDVPSGPSVVLKEIDKGEYQYETVYEIPAGATSSSIEGEASGTFVMDAGTKILVIYTSTFIEGTYTIYTSITTSDDQTPPDPIGP